MRLHELNKIITGGKKRLGRGLGSGKGKTGGRGTKGQKARGKIPATFTGGMSLFKKLPLKRGKGNSNSRTKQKVINLSKLNFFKAKEVVDTAKLLEAKIITEKEAKSGVKVLSDGELGIALTVKLSTSAAARKKIENVGGKVIDV